jgi:hypothetical protein
MINVNVLGKDLEVLLDHTAAASFEILVLGVTL